MPAAPSYWPRSSASWGSTPEPPGVTRDPNTTTHPHVQRIDPSQKLSLDHLIPQLKGGPDAADNITYACRSCNSSKGPKDMVLWLASKGRFPAVLVFRRYLKLAARYCEDANLMDVPWDNVADATLPFDKRALRIRWPELSEHRLWPDPPDR